MAYTISHADVLELLADPTRRAVFEAVARHPRAVGELAAGLPVSRPAVSQHLKRLKDAGLVDETPDGTRRIYAARREALLPLRRYLESFWDDALVSFGEHRTRRASAKRADSNRAAGPCRTPTDGGRSRPAGAESARRGGPAPPRVADLAETPDG